MIKIIDWPICTLLAALFFIVGNSSTSIAASSVLPPNWPWRGVGVSLMQPPNADDMQYLKKIGVNAISIQMWPRLKAKNQKISGREAFKRELKLLDTLLNECKLRGITAVITIYQFPMDPAGGLTQDSSEFWDNPELLKEAVYVAGELARRFHGRGKELGAYAILTEPLVVRDISFAGIKIGSTTEVPQAWPGLMRDIVKEIRKYDKTRFVSVTPGLGGMPAGYTDFTPLDDPYIIYEAHMYQPHDFTHQGVGAKPIGYKYPGGILWWSFTYWDADVLKGALYPLRRFQKKYNVPVWIGEFSAARWAEGGNQYLKDLIGIFDSDGLAWTYYCFKCWHGWNPDYADYGDYGESGVYDNSGDGKLDYRGRNTARWSLLRAAFNKNRIREARTTGKASR